MGFFSKLFSAPKPLHEQIAEQKETKWYESNSSNLLVKIFVQYDEEEQENAVNLMCLNYFESLENIKALNASNQRVDTVIMAKEMTATLKKIYSSYADSAEKAFYTSQAFKESKNPFCVFAKKLNHSFYGSIAFIISNLIFMGKIDVNNAWLFDKNLFNVDVENDNENGDALYEKVAPFLMEKGILNNETIVEIQEYIGE